MPEIETNPKESIFGRETYFKEQVAINYATNQLSHGLWLLNPEIVYLGIPFPMGRVPIETRKTKSRNWLEKAKKSLEEIM